MREGHSTGLFLFIVFISVGIGNVEFARFSVLFSLQSGITFDTLKQSFENEPILKGDIYLFPRHSHDTF